MRIGVDICNVRRIERVYRRFGDRFLDRVYHNDEKIYFKANPSMEFLASRWAVKEAVYKAFGQWRIEFPDIQLTREKLCNDISSPNPSLPLAINGGWKPKLIFHGKTKALAVELGITTSLVSISHDTDYVIAQVVLLHN